MVIQKVSADRLNPAAYNPRRDLKPGDRDYEKLKRSIEEFGFVEPVVWNERTGFVVGGHQRLKVLLDMGETEIDCVVVDLEPDREKAPNLALNRIQGDWDEGEDWTSPDVWKKANPSLGITVEMEKLVAACDSARQNPAEENLFRQLRLCQWVKQAVRWMPMELWDKCAFAVDPEGLRGRACYGGLDLSSTTDITAFVLVFPPEDMEDKYMILPFFWIPEENLDLRVRRDHVPYDVWNRQGFLKTTEGNVVHYGFIEAFIEELGMAYHILEIAFDRWGATQMVQNLEGLGFTVVPFGQGFRDMSPPTKELMRLILEGRLGMGGIRFCGG